MSEEDYQAQRGDIYILEVTNGRFTLHQYNGQQWTQLGAGFSRDDINLLIPPMELLFESEGHRKYYRLTGESSQ